MDRVGTIAREVVFGGLADREAVRRIYEEFALYGAQEGPRGFVRLLYTRGLLDRAGVEALRERLGRIDEAAPAEAASPTYAVSPGAPSPGATMGFDEVLGDPGAAPGPGATMGFDEVLPPRPSPGATMGFDEVLGGRPSPGATMGFDEVLLDEDEPPRRSGGTLGFDRVLPGFGQAVPAARPGPRPAEGESFDPIFRLSAESLAARPPSGAGRPPSSSSAVEATGSGSGSDAGNDITATSRLRALQIGEHLGDYELLEVLGQGGMGVIYKAARGGDPGFFAVKVLLAGEDPDGRRRTRFEREVEAIRRLDHQNVVRVHEAGTGDGLYWYAMDYVAGTDLQRLLSDGALTREERLRVFVQVCDAVDHAHAKGVIHRDLKPSNVLLDFEQRVSVVDFGLVKFADEERDLTRTGSALGTFYYMSPEQLTSPSDVDARADVFALGIILYELMTGRRPFTGRTAGELTKQILNDEPARPTSLDAELPRWVDQVCRRALEKDASHRTPSVAALRAEVARHLDSPPNSSVRASVGAAFDRAVEPVGVVRRWVRRNRAGFVAGGIAAVVLLIPVVFLLWYLSRP